MKTEWRMSVRDQSVMLFMSYTKPTETGGMDSGASRVIAQGVITTNMLDLKRNLWNSVRHEYGLGEFNETA